MAIPFLKRIEEKAPLFVDTIKGLPKAFSETIGQPSMRAYAGVAGAITGKPLTPSTTFQKELYGTDKPISFRSVGEEVLPQGNKFAPALGAFFGLADVVPSSKGVKGGVKVSGQVSKKLLPKTKHLTTNFLDFVDQKLTKNPQATISKQEVLDFARRPELKKGEADMLMKKLEEFELSGTKVYHSSRDFSRKLKDSPKKTLSTQSSKLSAQEFADSIRRDLLELKTNPRRITFEESEFKAYNIDARTTKAELKSGYLNRPGKNYEEVVFESPITTNGSSHYPNSKNYFAHARGDEVIENGKKIWREQEIQSDIVQREGIDRSIKNAKSDLLSSLEPRMGELRKQFPNIKKSEILEYIENCL